MRRASFPHTFPLPEPKRAPTLRFSERALVRMHVIAGFSALTSGRLFLFPPCLNAYERLITGPPRPTLFSFSIFRFARLLAHITAYTSFGNCAYCSLPGSALTTLFRIGPNGVSPAFL